VTHNPKAPDYTYPNPACRRRACRGKGSLSRLGGLRFSDDSIVEKPASPCPPFLAPLSLQTDADSVSSFI